jgi:hypothetical protein
MPRCAMIEKHALEVKMNVLSDYHSGALRILLLTAIFLFGYLEGAVFKRKDWACATWFTGLAALTAWIVYPLTTVRICIGAIVLVSGVIVMTIYYTMAGGK